MRSHVTTHARFQVSAGRFREASASVVFRLIHHMPGRGDLQDPVQTERATGDILDKPLKRIAVGGGNEYALVNAEFFRQPKKYIRFCVAQNLFPRSFLGSWGQTYSFILSATGYFQPRRIAFHLCMIIIENTKKDVCPRQTQIEFVPPSGLEVQ